MAKPWSAWRQVLREAAADWGDDEAPRLGASTAYYTAFSIAPQSPPRPIR